MSAMTRFTWMTIRVIFVWMTCEWHDSREWRGANDTIRVNDVVRMTRFVWMTRFTWMMTLCEWHDLREWRGANDVVQMTWFTWMTWCEWLNLREWRGANYTIRVNDVVQWHNSCEWRDSREWCGANDTIRVNDVVWMTRFTWMMWCELGVDRLSAWPILSILTIIDIGHFKNRFADIFIFFFLLCKQTYYLQVTLFIGE